MTPLLLGRGQVAKHSVDGGNTGHIISIADSLGQESVSDLPGEDAGALSLVVGDLVHHSRSSHTRLGSSDSSGLDGPCLVISSKYFRNATIGDLEDSGDVARSGSLMSEFNNLLSSGVRQWSPIDIHSSQLIDPTVT